jgi:hypothetical protein
MELESQGVELKRRARVRRVAWATVAWVPAWIVRAIYAPGALFPGGLGVWISVASFVAALWGLVTLVRLRLYTANTAPTKARRPALVSVTETEMTVSNAAGVWRWPLSDIDEGWVEEYQGDNDVVLRTRRDDLVAVRVASPGEGAELLRAVGVSADKQVARFRLAEASASSSPVGCICLAGGLVLPFVLFGAATGLWLSLASMLRGGAEGNAVAAFAAVFVVALVAAFLALRAMVPPRATVGLDGVELRGLGWRRFVPLDSVSGVESTERGVTLRLREGSPVALTTFRNTSDGVQGHPATRAALLRRIEDALAARLASQAQVARAAALERHGRPFARWRAELAALAGPDADYRRSAGLARDDLQRVLEDAAAPIEHRVGAAVALAAAGEVDIRRRVRIAAAACADRDLRAALEAAAEEELDEAKLERALRRAHDA